MNRGAGAPANRTAREAGEPLLGDNVLQWRLRRGYSQEELAHRAGVHVNVVRKLEQSGPVSGPAGVRLDTLYRLARALAVQTAHLWARRGVEPADQDPGQLALLPIRVALTPPLPVEGATAGPEPSGLDLRALGGELERAVRLYHGDHYDAVAMALPGMISAAQSAVTTHDEGGRRDEALRLRAGVLLLAGWFLTQVRASDLAYQAIKDAIADATAAGGALAVAAGIAGECWLFIRRGGCWTPSGPPPRRTGWSRGCRPPAANRGACDSEAGCSLPPASRSDPAAGR